MRLHTYVGMEYEVLNARTLSERFWHMHASGWLASSASVQYLSSDWLFQNGAKSSPLTPKDRKTHLTSGLLTSLALVLY
jgi:hypothetical protein